MDASLTDLVSSLGDTVVRTGPGTITGASLADLLCAAVDADAVDLRQMFPRYEFLENNAVLEQGWSAIPIARPRRPRAQNGAFA